METTPQPNSKVEKGVYEKIDCKSPQVMAALAEAPVFKKHAKVQVRPAVEGEHIITMLMDGMEETANTAKADDWVVTNPSGEQYIISKDKLLSRYEPSETTGIYQAKGYCRAIRNPFGKPIEIMTSWGQTQLGEGSCMIACDCDADGNNMRNEPPLIDWESFIETYSQTHN